MVLLKAGRGSGKGRENDEVADIESGEDTVMIRDTDGDLEEMNDSPTHGGEDVQMQLQSEGAALFQPATAKDVILDSRSGGSSSQKTGNSKSSATGQTRKVQIPPHRMTPLRTNWMSIYTPLVQHMKLQVRMNERSRPKTVEIRESKWTEESGALQKGADFVKAFALGFDVKDAEALLRLDDIYIDTFEIKDVKTLQGDHLSRAIGRIAGQGGKTRITIENASRTRIVLAETKIHILGSFANTKIARDAIVNLILGSPPGKVYAGLRTVASRMRERF